MQNYNLTPSIKSELALFGIKQISAYTNVSIDSYLGDEIRKCTVAIYLVTQLEK